MSTANECDLCGQLYRPEKGTVHFERVLVMTKGGLYDTWDEIDFCPTCSKAVMKVIGPALEGWKS